MLDMIGQGLEWMEANIWNDLDKNHWNKEEHKIKCEITCKNIMTMKDESILSRIQFLLEYNVKG